MLFGGLNVSKFSILNEANVEEVDRWGYPTAEPTKYLEFEGIIDNLTRNRHSSSTMTIFPDTTHVIITGYREDILNRATKTDRQVAIIDERTGTLYNVIHIDDPAGQGHHLEIEVRIGVGQL